MLVCLTSNDCIFSYRCNWQVACGWGHSLAVSHSGDLYAWGHNDCGQLGLGTTQKLRYLPGLVRRLPDDWEDQQQELQAMIDANAARIGASGVYHSCDRRAGVVYGSRAVSVIVASC